MADVPSWNVLKDWIGVGVMTEFRACDSDSDDEVMAQSRPNPPPKRRRIHDPSAVTAAPIYSDKVTRNLQLNKPLYKQVDCTEVNEEEARLWPPSPPRSKSKPISMCLSDSEEEPEKPQLLSQTPSTTRVNKKTRKVNKKLDKLNSLVCLTPERTEDIPDLSGCPSQITDCHDDDDIIIISSKDKQKRRPGKPKPRKRAREISLKFRLRMDVHRIPVLSTDPLSKAVAQLSVKLKVPPSKILLMRNDAELPVHSTIMQLDLGIADIIDCLVITDDREDESSCDVITLRLQGKEKGSAREYSLDKHAPLGSILSRHTAGLSAAAKRKVKFLYDGLKVKHNQTPSQLDMEDGDVIDVWA